MDLFSAMLPLASKYQEGRDYVCLVLSSMSKHSRGFIIGEILFKTHSFAIKSTVNTYILALSILLIHIYFPRIYFCLAPDMNSIDINKYSQ